MLLLGAGGNLSLMHAVARWTLNVSLGDGRRYGLARLVFGRSESVRIQLERTFIKDLS